MRDNNKNMIELLDVSINDNHYFSLIRHTISNEILKLRFGISQSDYVNLKRILEFRPFQNSGMSPYRYFFALSYRIDDHDRNIIYVHMRVEQLKVHKEYEFKISRKYIANIMWFESLTDKELIEEMIQIQ